ncbi:MAG: hypothetical protein ACXAEU_17770 [Candidatus Hodarchaeales archaeon]|jgi:hypothetical protein
MADKFNDTGEEPEILEIPEIFATEYRRLLDKHYPLTCNICYLWDVISEKCKLQYVFESPPCRQHRKRKQQYRDEAQDKIFHELVILKKGYPPTERKLLDFFPQHQGLEKSLEEKSDADIQRRNQLSHMGTARILMEIRKISKSLFRRSPDDQLIKDEKTSS